MLKRINYLFAIALAALIFTACDETTDPINPDPEPKPAAPSNLQATSIDKSTVGIKFTASVDESNTLFDAYYLEITPGNSPVEKITKDKINMYAIQGLNEGTEYTFKVYAKYTNDSVSAPISIKWAPAARFTKNFFEDTEPIKIYEYDSDFGSGLKLYAKEGSSEGPKTLKTASGKDWDLGINDKSGKIIFGSASKLGYSTVKPDYPTEINIETIPATSLNNVFDSQALNANPLKFAETTIDLSTKTEDFVAICRKKNEDGKYNYAKVLVKKGTNDWWNGSTPNRYITVEVSYQTVKDIPYAKVK